MECLETMQGSNMHVHLPVEALGEGLLQALAPATSLEELHIHTALAHTKRSASGSHFMKQPLQQRRIFKVGGEDQGRERRRRRVMLRDLRVADVLPETVEQWRMRWRRREE